MFSTIVVLAIAGCSTEKFKPSVDELAGTAGALHKTLETDIGPAAATARAELRDEAARNSDVWTLSDECDALRTLSGNPELSKCRIEKTLLGGRSPSAHYELIALRKSAVLLDYLLALQVLADATNEADMYAAYGLATEAIKNLGEVSGESDISNLAADLAKNSGKVEALVSEAFAAARYQRLKKLVTENDADVQLIISDIQLAIKNSEKDGVPVDKAFVRAAENLTAASDAMDFAIDDAEKIAAYAALEKAHGAFLTAYPKSLIGRYGLIAQAHSGLARALKEPASTDDMIKYLTAIRQLAETLKE